jgi:hypothetical protein
MTARFTWAEVCARRTARHGLSRPFDDEPDAVTGAIAAMCGAHAQVMSAAELSVGVRLSAITRTDIRDALWTRRSIVKTFGPRGTVHLLPSRDLPMWVAALSAIPSAPTSLPDGIRLTPEQTDDVVAAIGAALHGAELTIDELEANVVRATGAWAADLVVPAFGERWPRWRQAVMIAARRGVMCYGPGRGQQVTYTGPATWLPEFRPDARPAAASDLVRRFLHAYGPATPAEFAKWLGAPRAWAAELFASIADGLTRAVICDDPESNPRGAGDVAWVLAGDTDVPDAGGGVRLLPYFDAYGIGCHPRRLVFPGRAADRLLTHGAAGTYPILLVGGIAAGIWHHRAKGRRIDLTVEPFVELSAALRGELDDQVARVGEILEGDVDLTLGSVTIAAHK